MTVWPDGLLAALAEGLIAGRLAAMPAAHIEHGLPFAWFYLVAVFSHLAGQSAAHVAARKSQGDNRRTLFLLWLLPGICLGFVAFLSRDYLGLAGITVLLLTWILCSARGIGAVTQSRHSDNVRNVLVWGTVVLASVSFFSGAGAEETVIEVAGFLLLCSALIVLMRRREVAKRAAVEDRTPWAAGGVTFVSLVLLMVVLAYLAASGGIGAALGLLRHLLDYVAIALGYLITPVAYLVQWILVGLQRLLAGRSTNPLKMPGSLADDLLKQLGEDRNPGEFPLWLKWGALVFVVAGAGVIAWMLVSRFSRSLKRDAVQETRTSLAHEGAFRDWLQDAAQDLRALAEDAVSRLRSLIGHDPKSVEEIYAATIGLLAGRGIPRQPQMTPYEYRDFAGGQIPNEEGREALGRIAVIFTKCHYSERLPFAQELAAARSAYHRIAGTSFHVTSAQAGESPPAADSARRASR